MLNIGIRLHDVAPGTLEERLRTARDQGFRCVHLALSKTVRGFTMQEAPRLLTDDLAAQVKELLDKYGLTCAVLGCYLTPAAEGPDAAWINDCYQAHFRFSRLIGAGVVGSETPAAKGDDPTDPEMIRRMIRKAGQLADWAAEEGTILALEPVYRHIIRTPALAEQMLSEANRDNLRIILDGVNLLSGSTCASQEAIMDDAIARLGDRVAVLHMKDFEPVAGEEELRACACGTGRMKYEALLRFNRERGGLPMTLENTTPDNAVAAREHLERLSARL